MMNSMRDWWQARAPRERTLLAVLGVLIAATLLWLGLWRPITSGLEAGWVRQGEATDRAAAINGRLAALKLSGERKANPGVPLGQRVTQSVSEAGFTLDRAAPQGADGLAITIASARSSALLGWLARLESAGVIVETISIAPGAATGVVSVQAVLRESR
jgi:general secretion pathway protein M